MQYQNFLNGESQSKHLATMKSDNREMDLKKSEDSDQGFFSNDFDEKMD